MLHAVLHAILRLICASVTRNRRDLALAGHASLRAHIRFFELLLLLRRGLRIYRLCGQLLLRRLASLITLVRPPHYRTDKLIRSRMVLAHNVLVRTSTGLLR